jgi:putative oxidoreductase
MDKGPMPEALGYNAVQLAVSWGEAGCGLLLLLGGLTRLAALAMIVVQLGAIFMVTYARGFSSFGGAFASGYEYNVALVAMCLTLALTGAGSLSVDAWWFRPRHKKHHEAPAEPAVV